MRLIGKRREFIEGDMETVISILGRDIVLKTPFDLFWDPWYEKGKQRALKDPEYLEWEEKLRNPDGTTTWNREGFERQNEIFDRVNPYPRHLKVLSWFHHHRSWRPNHWRATTKHYRQRIQRGVSYRDVWNLDYYLSQVIEQGMLELAEQTHGWPGDPMTFDEWQELLRKIAVGFRAFRLMHDLELEDDDKRKEYEQQWQEAGELFIKWYGHFWD